MKSKEKECILECMLNITRDECVSCGRTIQEIIDAGTRRRVSNEPEATEDNEGDSYPDKEAGSGSEGGSGTAMDLP